MTKNQQNRLAVIAVGGNALITDPDRISIESEIEAVQVICAEISDMIEAGWDVIIGHGNGPQIGFNLRRSELASHEIFEIPLDVCGTFTQGSIGYYIQQSLQNIFHKRGINKHVVTVITQVEIDEDDPAFANPTKPIGMFMTAEEAQRIEAKGWQVIEDAGRGWRRVVASPTPQHIVELPVIKKTAPSGSASPIISLRQNGDQTCLHQPVHFSKTSNTVTRFTRKTRLPSSN